MFSVILPMMGSTMAGNCFALSTLWLFPFSRHTHRVWQCLQFPFQLPNGQPVLFGPRRGHRLLTCVDPFLSILVFLVSVHEVNVPPWMSSYAEAGLLRSIFPRSFVLLFLYIVLHVRYSLFQLSSVFLDRQFLLFCSRWAAAVTLRCFFLFSPTHVFQRSNTFWHSAALPLRAVSFESVPFLERCMVHVQD